MWVEGGAGRVALVMAGRFPPSLNCSTRHILANGIVSFMHLFSEISVENIDMDFLANLASLESKKNRNHFF